MSEKPEGELEVVETRIHQNHVAIYYDVILKDKNGDLWQAHSSAFRFDLKPIEGEVKNEK